MIRRILLSTLAVVTLGSLLHFAWTWSGRSTVVAVFAAVNESTWEHLKLAFWPALVVGLVQRFRYRNPPGWLPATALRTLVPPLLIIGLFYGYTAVLNRHHLVFDLATFVFAVLGGEVAGHAVMERATPAGARIVAALIVLASMAAFGALSFAAPDFFLFEVPQ